MEENHIVQELQPGTELQNGKYRIVRKLGQGGFGITYEGVQIGLERPVAVKEFFMKDYCNRDSSTSQVSIGSDGSMQLVESFRKKFLKEALFIAQMDNVPHVIRIYDVFEENGTAYYVMEYVNGGSLKQLVARSGALPEQQALGYIRQLGLALCSLHQNNILHLDVKPDNVLLNSRGEAVLIDFGISKRYDKSGSQTSSSPVGLSKGYAPSEQYQEGGMELFTPATDIYSLGATLFFLLVGHTPPDANDILENGLPSCPARVRPKLWQAIDKAMQPRKKDRPQSVEAFLSMLDSDNSPTVAAVSTAAGTVSPTVAVVPPPAVTEIRTSEYEEHQDDDDGDNKNSSSLRKWMFVALALAALTAVFFLFILPGNKNHKKEKSDDDTEFYIDEEEEADDMDVYSEDSLPVAHPKPERSENTPQPVPDRRANATSQTSQQQQADREQTVQRTVDEPQQQADEQKIFNVVEQQPSFPQGDPRVWIGNNIHYPPVAEENGVQGQVVCQFVVETDGSISNVTVVRGADPSLDKEAVRVIKSMPKWYPGRTNGRAVRVKYTIPVKFSLQ